MPNPNRYRCPECRTRRTDPHLMVLHIFKCKRPLCHCLRVTHPHRPGSFPLCEQNFYSDILKAALEGATREDVENILLERAWDHGGVSSKECPF
jgi:hypothetical protein